MYKGINLITNEGTNKFYEFWWIYIFYRVYPETVKVDLDVRLNRAYPQRKRPQKVPEDSRGLHTEVEPEWLPHVSPSFECRFSTVS